MILAFALFDTILKFILGVDEQLLLLVNGNHAPFWDYFMALYSDRFVWIPLYVAIFYLLLRVMSWRMALLGLAVCGLIILFCDQTTSHLIRPYVMRLRPSQLDNPLSAYVHIVDGYRGGRFSFPSAHSANTWGLTFFVFFLFRKRILTGFMFFWAVLTCYSRMYLGVHYPTDLLVGMCIGLVGASVAYYLFQRYSAYKRTAAEIPPRHYLVPVVVGLLTMVGILVYAGIANTA